MRNTKTLFFLLAHALFAGLVLAADTLTIGGTAPTTSLTVPSAGEVFTVVSNNNSTISFTTDATLGFRKITVNIDDAAGNLPSGVQARVKASPALTQGTGHTVILSTTAGDLIRDIGSGSTVNDMPLLFDLLASLDASPVSDSRTLKYTILMQ